MTSPHHPSPHGTILNRDLWPALLAGARTTVREHAAGKLCNNCINAGDCGGLRQAQMYLSDPEMLRVEAEAAAGKATP